MALTDKLTAIADAIRAKTGESGTMTLGEMPGKIAAISGGGGTEKEFSLYYVNNTQYDVKCVLMGAAIFYLKARTSAATPFEDDPRLTLTEFLTNCTFQSAGSSVGEALHIQLDLNSGVILIVFE